MGWFDRIRGAFGKADPDAAAMRVDGDRIVFTNVEEARRRVPREPYGVGPASLDACSKCQRTVRQIVFTTAGGGTQVEVWRAYPIAVDGWVCTSCGTSVLPRRMSAQEITEVLEVGVTHARESRLDDAEYWFLRAVSSWPEYPPALANLAQVYIQRSHAKGADRASLRQDAVRLLRRAAQVPEHCPNEAIIELARLEAMLGEEAPALERLDALAGNAGIDQRVRDEASALATDIRKGKGLFSRAAELVEGRLMLAGGRWSRLDEQAARPLRQAVALLTEATQRNPSAFATWWTLGKIHQRLGERELARESFEQALRVDPNQVDGCREYVSSCLDVGQPQQALPIAERACSLKPDDVGLRANLALVQLFAGQADEASSTVAKALRAAPDDPVTKALAKVITDVREGRRKLPRTLAELEGRT